MSDQLRGGETFSPSQVNWTGTVSPSEKAALLTSTTAPPWAGFRATSPPPHAAGSIATSIVASPATSGTLREPPALRQQTRRRVVGPASLPVKSLHVPGR